MVLSIIYIGVLLSAIFCYFHNSVIAIGEEFFITYSAGFIKRGLVGSIILSINQFFNRSGVGVVHAIVIVLIILNLTLITALFIWKKIDLYILLASFLLLNIYARHIAYRLDLILIPLFFIQLLLIRNKKIKPNWKYIFISLLICLGILIHEVYFFVSFWVTVWAYRVHLKIKSFLPYFITFFPSCFLFLLMITFFKGDETQIATVITSWRKFNVKPETLNYLKWLFSLNSPIYIWENAAFLKNKVYYLGFILNYIVVCGVFYLYIKSFFNLKSKSNVILILGNFLIILLLCIIATDFIRWYNMILLQIIFVALLFFKKKTAIIDFKYISLKLSVLFLGLPMYGWTPTHFYWTAPVKYLIDLKNYL